MTDAVRYTLLPEGSSDRALLSILEWAVSRCVRAPAVIVGDWVDTDRLPWGRISEPRDRLRSAVEVYPCEILFIHRDADGDRWEARRAEIDDWLDKAQLGGAISPVPIIPIRKSEACCSLTKRRFAGPPAIRTVRCH